MDTFFAQSAFFGVVLSLATFTLGSLLKKKFKLAIFNPIIISVTLCIIILVAAGISYDTYNASAKYISWFLTPATVCFAIPLYEKVEVLKKNYAAILVGIFSGVLTSLVTALVLCMMFALSHEDFVTLIPKSITTAIGVGLSEELGGYVNITVAVIVITGNLGNVMGPTILKLFKIEEPIAKGVALGTSSHAIGTTKAMELGEVEGAISSLSIAVAGLLTVALAIVFQGLW